MELTKVSGMTPKKPKQLLDSQPYSAPQKVHFSVITHFT